MSLKTFHLFFLCIAILFDFAFAAYAWFGPENKITEEIRPMGIGSGIFGLLLVAYGIWFYTKKAPKIIV
jgi:hypothetical protein